MTNAQAEALIAERAEQISKSAQVRALAVEKGMSREQFKAFCYQAAIATLHGAN